MATETSLENLVINQMTKAQYEALSSIEPNQLYLIDEEPTDIQSDWSETDVSSPTYIQNKPSIPTKATAVPLMDGTAAIGDSANYAAANHVHPTDTSRASASELATLQSNVSTLSNTVDATEAHVDQVEGRLTDYLPLSGGTLTGDLNISGANLSVDGAVTIGNRAAGSTVGANSFAQGEYITASSNNSHAEGQRAAAKGLGSHAEGINTTADGNYSHAEGRETTATGTNSHAEGESTIATGYASHAEGNSTNAIGSDSHAEGNNTIARGPYSHTEGYKSETLSGHDYAFAWNGNASVSTRYQSHGPGTFNINPVNGLSGFYIGEQNLAAIFESLASKVTIRNWN